MGKTTNLRALFVALTIACALCACSRGAPQPSASDAGVPERHFAGTDNPDNLRGFAVPSPTSAVGALSSDGGAWYIGNPPISNLATGSLSPGTAGQVVGTDGGSSFWQYPGASNARFQGATAKIQLLGDSQTAGPYWRWPFGLQLRSLRTDWDFIGTQIITPTSFAPIGLWYDEGHAGLTCAQLASGYAGYVATSGCPNIAIVMCGTNDIAGGANLATTEANWNTLSAQIATSCPNAHQIGLAPPPFVAGTTVGGNLASWNAVQSGFATYLSGTWATPASNPVRLYSGCAQGLGPGDINNDGVHLLQTGGAKVGSCLAPQLDAFMGERPAEPLPRAFNDRQWAGSMLVTTPSTDGASVAADSALNPGTASFAFGLDFFPTSVGNAACISSTCAIATYNNAAAGGWALLSVNTGATTSAALRLYWNSGSPTIGSGVGNGASESALLPNKWHRIVFMCASGACGLYVNAQLVGLVNGVSAWSFAQQTFYLGLSTFRGAPGYYSNVQTFSGSSVPVPGSQAALLAAERDYYLGQSVVPGNMTSWFGLSTVWTDTVYNNPTLVAQGSASLVQAFPNGTPIRPWEYQAQGPGLEYFTNGGATSPLNAWGSDLSTSTATNQYVSSISGANGAGGTVTSTATSLSFSQASSVVTSSGNLTIDAPSASNLNLCSGTCGTVVVGNSAHTLVNEIIGHPVEVFVQSTQVENLNAGAGDYLYLDTSQHTQLTPGKLATTSGSLTCDSAAALNLGNTNATSIVEGNSANTTSISQTVKSSGTITNVVGSNTVNSQGAASGDFSGYGTSFGTNGHVRCTSADDCVDSPGTLNLGTTAATNVTSGNTTTTAAYNVQMTAGGLYAINAGGTFPIEINASTIYPGSFGNTAMGGSTLPFGNAYLGANTTAGSGYTVFPAISGTHNSQDGITQYSVFEGRISNHVANNFNTYQLSAHHGMTVECSANARVVTAGVGCTTFWNTASAVADATFACEARGTGYCTTSSSCTGYAQPFYFSCDVTGSTTPASGGSPTNPILAFAATTNASDVATITWTAFNGSCATSDPVLDIVSKCIWQDN